MKKILTILFILISVKGYSQSTTPQFLGGKNSNLVVQAVFNMADSPKASFNLILPDTTTAKTYFSGNLKGRWARQNGRLYYNPSGLKFMLADSVTGGGGGNADSATFYTNYRADTSRANIYSAIASSGGSGTVTAIAQGYGISVSPTNPITSSGSIRVDTTAISTKANVVALTANKVNYSDTSAMLANYLNIGDIGVSVQGYDANTTILGNATTGTGSIVRQVSPTLTLPSISAINVSGGILSLPTGASGTLMRLSDTSTLSERINTKLNITDTANIRLRPIAGTNMTITGTYPNITFNSSGGASGVTSVATTNGTGITGGTITTTGTLAIDTANVISTKLYRQKAVDSLNTLIALKLNIANPTATGTLTTPALTISSLTSGSTSDSVVTVNAATGVLYRRAFPSSGGGGWSLTGNSVASVPLLGTTTNYNVDFIANNLRLGRMYSSTFGVAWGEGATATGFWGNAHGYGATASGQHGVSIGSYTEASDVGATAVGYGAKAPNFASFNLSSNGGSGNYTTTVSRQGLLGADTRIDMQITAGVNILSVTADNVIANKPVTLKSYTVATLPSAAANTGAICYVTDASAPTYNATVTGGGAVLTIVFSNGTNWTCH